MIKLQQDVNTISRKDVFDDKILSKTQIVFLDIDGTLRNDQREVTERTLESIQNLTSQGVKVVLSSGRCRAYTINLSKECNASNYVICSSGGEGYDYENDVIIFSKSISSQKCKELYQFAKANNLRYVMNVEDGKIIISEEDYESGDIYAYDDSIDEILNTHEVTQCVFLGSDYEQMKSLAEMIDDMEEIYAINKSKCLDYDDVPITSRTYYDMICKGMSKGRTAIMICDYLNIDLSSAVAIGDGDNDIQLLQAVGYPIAMGNATEDLKKCASYVTDTNNDDGVAKVLDHIYSLIKC